MKKKALALVLALMMCMGLTVQAAGTQPDADQVYSAMIALQDEFPEGTPWTDDNFYSWKGGVYAGGGGCAGFAFMLSDAAFGTLPGRLLTSFSYDDVQVGDILRINNNTHSVIVLEVHPDHVVLAEGNFNKTIHWGRSLSKSDVLQATYLITRYPESVPEPDAPDPEESAASSPLTPTEDPSAKPVIEVENIPTSGTAVSSTQFVTVDGKAVEFQMYALLDADGNSTNYIKLRDLAYILNGTAAQFNVGWDGAANVAFILNGSTPQLSMGPVGAVNIETGKKYTPNGSEMHTPFSGDRAYEAASAATNVNGSPAALDAIVLKDDQGGAFTYYKLRDLGKALGFHVDYSHETGVFVETDKPYSE